jgi:hypothetical protein
MTGIGADTATFVMPHYGDDPLSSRHLDRAVDGLLAQTEPGWRLVIVDDATPGADARRHLAELERRHPGRIHVLPQSENCGPGRCRNLGVRWAAQQGSDLVLFQDADDVPHPRRLERTRALFAARPEVDFAYSTFVVIDEDDRPVPPDRLTPSIEEILQSHLTPVEGPGAGVGRGVDPRTSTVAVRTSLAVAEPFPEERGCEDAHAWLRMSASGSSFAFLPDTPGSYRIPQHTNGSSDRSRLGDLYYRRKAEVEYDGFRSAAAIAVARGALAAAEVPELTAQFLRRLAVTLEREEQTVLAKEVLLAAAAPTELRLGSAG